MEYQTFKGDPSQSVFWHMLQHVVNHATFHRGQVTTMMRQLGAAPPKSQDLITYYRERSAHQVALSEELALIPNAETRRRGGRQPRSK